jgi:hypothetical protein
MKLKLGDSEIWEASVIVHMIYTDDLRLRSLKRIRVGNGERGLREYY